MNIQIKDRLILASKIVVCVIAIVLVYLIGMYLRKDIPLLEIKDVYIKSTANATHLDDNMAKSWNLNIYQTNDLFIKFGQVENVYTLNNKDRLLKNVYIDNIQIVQTPQLGDGISIYTISQNQDRLFEYTEQYLVQDKIEYKVLPNSASVYNLEVNNTSGQLALSFVNNNVLEYIYENVNELVFDGTLLQKAEVQAEQIEFVVSFDITFITESDKEIVYNLTTKLPYGDILELGTVITSDKQDIQIIKK